MALKSSAADPVSTREGGFRFEMLDGEKVVTVYVSNWALLDLDHALAEQHGGLLAVFDQHRDRIDQAAARKYQAKRLEGDGSVSLGAADFPKR